jgi:hypothetical protein
VDFEACGSLKKKKVEIEQICKENTAATPGTKAYMGGYQKALAQVVDGLTEEEETEYQILAEEWTKQSPPTEVQQR